MADLILASIHSALREVDHYFSQHNYALSMNILLECKINLDRIRQYLEENRYNTICASIDGLITICQENRELTVENCAYETERQIVGRGRPSLQITREQIVQLFREGFTAPKMAFLMKCSASSIYKISHKYGIKFRERYTQINDEELRSKIIDLNKKFPNAGSEMILSCLRADGLMIQRSRVRRISTEVDPLGVSVRWNKSIKRRIYSVPCPNSLWHMDAHCKLVRWGIITHGCIDGYSRIITYLQCATSCSAETVLNMFTPAILKYGVPSRVRSDHGYENMFVALLMKALRGFSRGSHITGRSVHNQRIERLWRDVFNQVIEGYYNEFYDMEDSGLLDINNQYHLFVLQQVYVRDINKKLLTFRKAWNNHKIRTAGHQSPRQLWISGVLLNINSNHTSIKEIYGNNETLFQRLSTILEELGLNLEDIIVEGVNPQMRDQLEEQVGLSEIEKNEFQQIIVREEFSPRNRYLTGVNFFRNIRDID